MSIVTNALSGEILLAHCSAGLPDFMTIPASSSRADANGARFDVIGFCHR
jgi:hypothetical protein